MRRISVPLERLALGRRIEGLTATARRCWGTMAVEQVLPHCTDQIRVALGEQPIDGVRGPLRWWPVNRLAVHVLPWPGGWIRGPREMFACSGGQSIDDDRVALLGALDRFVQRLSDEPDGWPPHPMLGRLRGVDWDVLVWRHLDHHLRQFGR